MLYFIKKKPLDQNEAATVQDSCTVARQQMEIFGLCPSNDCIRDSFNEVSYYLSGNLVGALKKLTQRQVQLKQHRNKQTFRTELHFRKFTKRQTKI